MTPLPTRSSPGLQFRPLIDGTRHNMLLCVMPRPRKYPVIEGYKTCSRCKESKKLELFNRNKCSSDGLGNVCKPCGVRVACEWQRNNKERVREKNERWRQQNLEQVASYNAHHQRIWRTAKKANDPQFLKDRERVYTLRRVGMTLDQYEAMAASQNGCCGICGRKKKDGERPFAVDHDHKCCGANTACAKCHRGILCSGCNTALHKLETMDGWVDKAVAYLQRYKEQSWLTK